MAFQLKGNTVSINVPKHHTAHDPNHTVLPSPPLLNQSAFTQTHYLHHPMGQPHPHYLGEEGNPQLHLHTPTHAQSHLRTCTKDRTKSMPTNRPVLTVQTSSTKRTSKAGWRTSTSIKSPSSGATGPLNPLFLTLGGTAPGGKATPTAPGGMMAECSNCGATHTLLWRRGLNDELNCSVCSLYRKLHKCPHPKSMCRSHGEGRRGGASSLASALSALSSAASATPIGEVMSPGASAGAAAATTSQFFNDAQDRIDALAESGLGINGVDTVELIGGTTVSLLSTLASKRQTLSRASRSIAMLTLMDGLRARSNVVVMAATNWPNFIDPALCNPSALCETAVELFIYHYDWYYEAWTPPWGHLVRTLAIFTLIKGVIHDGSSSINPWFNFVLDLNGLPARYYKTSALLLYTAKSVTASQKQKDHARNAIAVKVLKERLSKPSCPVAEAETSAKNNESQELASPPRHPTVEEVAPLDPAPEFPMDIDPIPSTTDPTNTFSGSQNVDVPMMDINHLISSGSCAPSGDGNTNLDCIGEKLALALFYMLRMSHMMTSRRHKIHHRSAVLSEG
ncbi:hypothetical protein DFH29DRAFT_1041266 [Suillus ampliporus]|nr:hypothetical protein DFH29DRAFT_1041266 [Suillus ampliporus]